VLLLTACSMLIYSCGSGNQEGSNTTAPRESTERDVIAKSIAEGRGVGEVTEVNLEPELDEGMVKMGKSIYDMKCSSCHKLTDQRVVGPGFEGVTNRRKPEW